MDNIKRFTSLTDEEIGAELEKAYSDEEKEDIKRFIMKLFTIKYNYKDFDEDFLKKIPYDIVTKYTKLLSN